MSSLIATIRQFLSALRRRNVHQVGGASLIAAFVVVQLASLAAGAFVLPDWFEPMVWTPCALGFPIALVLAWALEIEGASRVGHRLQRRRRSPPAGPHHAVDDAILKHRRLRAVA